MQPKVPDALREFLSVGKFIHIRYFKTWQNKSFRIAEHLIRRPVTLFIRSIRKALKHECQQRQQLDVLGSHIPKTSSFWLLFLLQSFSSVYFWPKLDQQYCRNVQSLAAQGSYRLCDFFFHDFSWHLQLKKILIFMTTTWIIYWFSWFNISYK